VSAALSDLSPATVYHYRIVAVNRAGTARGIDRTFKTTASTPPIVTLRPVGRTTATTAVLNGAINPRGRSVSYHFEYGPSTAYGTASEDLSIQAGDADVEVSVSIRAFVRAATYHYRVVATSAGGTARSRSANFTTAAASDSLAPGDRLDPGDFLRSPDGRKRLVMQGDGNVVLYDDDVPVWASGTGGNDGAYVVARSDGDFVVFSSGDQALWATGTQGFPGAALRVQDDGNLVAYQNGHAIWTRYAGYIGDTLIPGGRLEPGAYLLSSDRRKRFVMQQDGNLVLYGEDTPIWASGTGGIPGATATMQGDGNLVVSDGGGQARWNSGTADFPGARLSIQDDANMVLYHQGHAIWTRGAGYLGDGLISGGRLDPGAYLLSRNRHLKLVMQEDGNLVLYQDGQPVWASGTGGLPGAYAVMQGDGNFVVYRGGSPLWHSQTAGHPGAVLAVQDDTNLVIYQGSQPVWSRFGGQTTGDDYPYRGATDCSRQFGQYSWCIDENGNGRFDGGEDISPRGFAYKNCTDFVAFRTNVSWSSFGFPAGKGNAVDWRAYAGNAGFNVTASPSVGDIAWWGASTNSGFGHVAVVTAVASNGTVSVEEYNQPGDGTYRGPGANGRSNLRADAYLHRR
jgi:hypothetical protein